MMPVLRFIACLAAYTALSWPQWVSAQALPQRVISVSPHITETMYALGLEDVLIGTIDGSDYPKAAKNLPRVGRVGSLSIEALMKEKPDLILAWEYSLSPQAIDRLQDFGVRVWVSRARDIAGIRSEVLALGRMFHQEERAQLALAAFDQRLNKAAAKVEKKKPLLAMIQISEAPVLTVNHLSGLHEALAQCHFRNAFAQSPMITPSVSIAQLKESQAEVLIVFHANWLKPWLAWPQLLPIARQQTFIIDENTLSRPNLSMIEGIETLCNARSRLP